MKLRVLFFLTVVLCSLFSPRALAAPAGDDAYRSTPRRVVAAFLVAGQAGDFVRAAALLDLSSLPPESQGDRGPVLAQQLHYVLEKETWFDVSLVSDQPEGDPEDGAATERIATMKAGGLDLPITLSRAADGRWAISTSTVASIPHLYEANGPGWIESRIPATFRARAGGLAAWQWLGLLVAMVLAIAIGRALTFIGTRIGARLARKTSAVWDDELVAALRRPSRFLFGALAMNELRTALALAEAPDRLLGRMLTIVTIGAAAWATTGLVGVVAHGIERGAVRASEVVSEGERRAVTTRVRVLRRVVNVAVWGIASALMLMQFDAVRSVGVSLLASAGVAGIVLGFAAQRTIGSLIAGIQLSFTQPIRIGDVVIVEKEWGTIEEVTLTFVVVRVWDERRLIVPMSRFLEQPFENWTKVSPELHGTVFFYADWTLPIDALREELDRIVVGNPLWDGRTKSVCVTNATERTIEVRALISARNAGDQWNLRIEVRERIIAWLQRYDGGRYLPRVRLDAEAPSLQRDHVGRGLAHELER
jgi:small-conductance mechanosensitive channel